MRGNSGQLPNLVFTEIVMFNYVRANAMVMSRVSRLWSPLLTSEQNTSLHFGGNPIESADARTYGRG